MKFSRKQVKTKKHGIVNVYTPEDLPRQLRYMVSSDGRRIILANSSSFEFLIELFLIISEPMDEQSIFYIQDNSPEIERFQEWFKLSKFHLDFVVSNYHSLATKPKYLKEIIDKSKRVQGETVELSSNKEIMDDIPYWKTDGIIHFKVHSKYLMCSSNALGFHVLARDAKWLVGFDDEETYMCDGHTHLSCYTNEEEVDTDYWYFYQDENTPN